MVHKIWHCGKTAYAVFCRHLLCDQSYGAEWLKGDCRHQDQCVVAVPAKGVRLARPGTSPRCWQNSVLGLCIRCRILNALSIDEHVRTLPHV